MDNEKPQKKHFHISSGVEALAATVVGLASGFVGQYTHTRSEYFKRLRDFFWHDKVEKLVEDPAYKPLNDHIKAVNGDNIDQYRWRLRYKKEIVEGRALILEDHGDKLGQIIREHISDVKENGHKVVWNNISKYQEQKSKLRKMLSKFSTEELGIESEGIADLFQGNWKRFNFIGYEGRLPIIFSTIGAMTVGAVGTIMLANSINVRSKLNSLIDKQDNAHQHLENTHQEQQHILDNQKALLDQINLKEKSR